MFSEQRFKALLDRYLAGEATPEEVRIIENWFEQGGDAGKPDLQLSEAERESLLENIHRRQERRRGIPMIWRWMAAAVVVGVVILTGVHKWSSAKREYVIVSVAKGGVKKITLPDGSTVWVNANSELAYYPDFVHHREVRLSGEALFDVAEDKAHPFAVVTRDSVRTEVLGTMFNVSSHKETDVVVLSGKVQVSKAGLKPAILTRQQGVRYNGAFVRMGEVPGQISAWTNGQWVYNNMRIGDLKQLLNDQYNITIRNTHTKGEDLQTGMNVNFSRRQQPEEIVNIFCELAGCHYRKADKATFEIFN